MIPYFSYSKKTVKESKTTGKRRLLKERLLWLPYIPLEMPQIEMMELTRPFPILWDLKMRLTIPALFTRYYNHSADILTIFLPLRFDGKSLSGN